MFAVRARQGIVYLKFVVTLQTVFLRLRATSEFRPGGRPLTLSHMGEGLIGVPERATRAKTMNSGLAKDGVKSRACGPYQQSRKPRWRAMVTAWVRSRAASLQRILFMRALIACSVTFKTLAICVF